MDANFFYYSIDMIDLYKDNHVRACVRACVHACVHLLPFSLKKLLLRNYCLDFYQIS